MQQFQSSCNFVKLFEKCENIIPLFVLRMHKMLAMKTAFEKQGILTFHIMHVVFAVILL